MQSKNKSKWREVSREIHEGASSLEEKSHTWNESCKDSAKREGDILKLAEMAPNDEKQEDEERHNINKLLRQLREERKKEDEARAFLEEMQKNLEEAQARASATEQKLSSKYDEYMRTWTEDCGRPHFLMDKKWQMLRPSIWQRTSKNFWTWHNKQGGWAQRNPENFGLKRRMTNKTSHSCLVCVRATKMEGIMTFAAEWCTTREVVILRVSASLFVVVNEWQYKVLDDMDKLTWDAYLSERSTSLAVQKA